MKVGDIVRARHWFDGELAVVLEKRPRGAIVRLKIITPHGMSLTFFVNQLYYKHHNETWSYHGIHKR